MAGGDSALRTYQSYVTLQDSVFSNLNGNWGVGIDTYGDPITPVTITNVTVTDCPTYGMVIRGRQVQVSSSTFRNCNTGFYSDCEAGVTITGSTFRGNLQGAIVDGGFGPVLYVDSVFENNGFPLAVGGALALRRGGASLLRCLFRNNTAQYGGAVHLFQCTPTLVDTNSTYVGNNASMYGGAMYIENYLTMAFAGQTFIGNSAQLGSVIWAGAGNNPLFTDTTITNHTNTPVYLTRVQSTTVVTRGYYAGNTGLVGGVFYIVGPNRLNVFSARFVNNTAQTGGVFYVDVGTATVFISGSTFTGNAAATPGGILTATFITVIGSTFTLGRAPSGAALYAADNGALSITGSTFSMNRASTAAGGNGGALLIGIQCTTTITSSTFTSNTANRGAGIYMDVGGLGFSLTYSYFSANNASYSGGAIDVRVGLVSGLLACYSIFVNNRAGFLGGALQLDAASVLQCVGCNFTHNTAPRGGAVAAKTADTVFTDSILHQNYADQEGGGIYCDTCFLKFVGETTMGGNTAPDGAPFWCNIGGTINVDARTRIVHNNQTVDPQYAGHCECGCCALTSTAVHLTAGATDCLLSPGRSCPYFCDVGFKAAGTGGATCVTGDTNTFSPPELCEAIECPALPTPINGYVTISSGLAKAVTGDTAQLLCNPGFNAFVNITNKFKCVGPNWIDFSSGQVPLCIAKPCQTLDNIQCGQVSARTGSFGATATYTCDPGYIGNDAIIKHCDVSGWTPTGAALCSYQPCSATPAAPANSTISITPQSTAFVPCSGQIATVTCDAGLVLSTTGRVSGSYLCSNATWPVLPTCIPGPCAPLNESVINGLLSQGATTANYTCLPGYVRSGNPQRHCDRQVWLGEPPTCFAATCNQTSSDDYTGDCHGEVTVGSTCRVACNAGTFRPGGGAPQVTVSCSQPVPNEEGVFVPGIPECRPCGDGNFAAYGALTCTACPLGGTTGQLRATAQTDCLCSEGTFEDHPGQGDCIPCVPGAMCTGAKTQPEAAAGFYGVNRDFVPCAPAAACAGGNKCSAGYKGELCGSCEDRYYRINGRCLACPSDGINPIPLAIIAGVIMAGLLVILVRPSDVSERARVIASLSIGISFVQVIATFSKLHIAWNSSSQSTFDVLSVINFNLEVLHVECVTPITFYTRYQFQMAIPFIVLGFFTGSLILFIAGFAVIKRPSLAQMKITIRQYGELSVAGYLSFLIVAYLNQAQATLSLFACQKLPDGKYGVQGAPDTECFSPEWNRNIIFSAFGIVMYIVGIPVLVHVVYFANNRKYGSFLAERALTSNFLVHKYDSQRWYWEASVMIRKLAIVAITTLIYQNAYLQIALCCAVSFVGLVAAMFARPFLWQPHNIAEQISLFGQLIVLLCGLLVINGGDASQAGSANVIAILCVAAVLTSLFFLFISEISLFQKVWRLNRKVVKSQPNGQDITRPALAFVRDDSGFVSLVTGPSQISVMGASGTEDYHLEPEMDAAVVLIAGPLIARASPRGTVIHVWDWKTHGTVDTLSAPEGVLRLAVCPTRVAAAVDRISGTVLVWSFENVEKETSPVIKASAPSEMLISDSGIAALHVEHSFLTAVDHAGVVRKYGLPKGDLLHEWQTGMTDVTHVDTVAMRVICATHAGRLVFLAASSKRKGRETSESLQCIHSHRGPITAMRIASDTLFTAGEDNVIILRDVQTGDYLQSFPTTAPAICLSVEPIAQPWPGVCLSWVTREGKSIVRKHAYPMWGKPIWRTATTPFFRFLSNLCKRKGDSTEEGQEGATKGGASSLVELQLIGAELGLPNDMDWRALSPAAAGVMVSALKAERERQKAEHARERLWSTATRGLQGIDVADSVFGDAAFAPGLGVPEGMATLIGHEEAEAFL